MRDVALFVRSRRALRTVLLLLAVAMVTAALSGLHVAVPLQASEQRSLQVPVLVFLPTLSAAIVSTGLASPVPDLERTSARPLWPLRLAHLVTLTATAVVTLGAAALFWPGSDAVYMAVRNTLGLTGIAALGGTLLNAQWGWTPVFAYAIFAFRGGTVAPGEYASWAWSLQPARAPEAAIIALALFAIGTAVHASKGAARADEAA